MPELTDFQVIVHKNVKLLKKYYSFTPLLLQFLLKERYFIFTYVFLDFF